MRVMLCSLTLPDLEFLNSVGKMANVIPVIGKADSMAVDELVAFKKKVRVKLHVMLLFSIRMCFLLNILRLF